MMHDVLMRAYEKYCSATEVELNRMALSISYAVIESLIWCHVRVMAGQTAIIAEGLSS
jgi:hypothetical protein